MSYTKTDNFEGGNGGIAQFSERLDGLVIEIIVANDSRLQYLFLDSIDVKALREYLKESEK